MTVSCQVERFRDIINEIVPMIDDHWREVGSYSDKFRRNIHFSDYMIYDADSRLLTVTARQDEDRKLVGYFVGALGLDIHRDTLDDPQRRVPTLSAIVYYIAPSHRGYGRALIGTVEREATARFGVQIVNIRVKPGMNRAGEFLAAIGYTPTETTYTRLIGEAASAGNRTQRQAAS